MERWGRNEFDIPMPTFNELMREQLLAPFFVFQVFCCALWCMDEYWYYSVFTLAMLVVFESTVVASRRRNMEDLRRLKPQTMSLMVHRTGRWVRTSSEELVPGDVVSVTRPTGSAAFSHTGDPLVIPADLLLVAGTAMTTEAMLTGESTPQRKHPIRHRDPTETLTLPLDRTHVLYGGTRILQHEGDMSSKLRTPDGGCLAVVLRTGFGTAQGELMRTIIFASERVTANSRETGLFILFLLVFALAASIHVLREGLADPTRDRYKLFLNCVMILTSVIPPELPMELSIAVNTSLLALAQVGVFCTEPFRIAMAGKVDVCCFDKTGTLTVDDLHFEGIASNELPTPGDASEERSPPAIVKDVGAWMAAGEAEGIAGISAEESALVLGACHALAVVDGNLVGDPLERAGMAGADWTLSGPDQSQSRTLPRRGARILSRHLFSSDLRRMSVVCKTDGFTRGAYWCLVKGAPEAIEGCLRRVPHNYAEAHRTLAERGFRVIALCAKPVALAEASDGGGGDSAMAAAARKMNRDEVERDLDFAGFAVFACPMKPQSAPALRILRESAHALIMITGDAGLTACHVAHKLGITNRTTLILAGGEDGTRVEWQSLKGVSVQPLGSNPAQSVANLAKTHDLAVTGDGVDVLSRLGALESVVPYVQVYARVVPEQKERVIRALRIRGLTVMMCGDGTNDVGALKAAHVGIALLAAIGGGELGGGEGSRGPSDRRRERGRGKYRRDGKGKDGNKGGRGGDRGEALDAMRLATPEERIRALAAQMEAADDRTAGGRLAVSVRPGDASLAAPFTARSAGVAPCVDVIRQGRAALVTTTQMFKILGLNCLSMAYVMSVQYLDGVKFGDAQMTASGLATAGMFLSLSRAMPLEQLAPKRPHATIFTPYVFLSVTLQFAVHLTTLIVAVEAAKALAPEVDAAYAAAAARANATDDTLENVVNNTAGEEAPFVHPLDADFKPSLVNTVSFLVNVFLQAATILVNYIGEPFCVSMTRNKPLLYSVLGAYLLLIILLTEAVPWLNESMEMVPMPAELARLIGTAAMVDLGACWVIEKGFAAAFPARASKVATALNAGCERTGEQSDTSP